MGYGSIEVDNSEKKVKKVQSDETGEYGGEVPSEVKIAKSKNASAVTGCPAWIRIGPTWYRI